MEEKQPVIELAPAEVKCVICKSEQVVFHMSIDFCQVKAGENGDVWYVADITEQTNFGSYLYFCEEHRPNLDEMLKSVSGSAPALAYKKYFHI
mgnify:CR=1 FL=1